MSASLFSLLKAGELVDIVVDGEPLTVSWRPRGPDAKLTITSAQRTEQRPMTEHECYEWTQGLNLSLPPAVAQAAPQKVAASAASAAPSEAPTGKHTPVAKATGKKASPKKGK